MKPALFFGLLAGLFLASSLAPAQDDPPSRVARLNFTSGNVSFQPGGVDDWVPAVINRPITTGDRLWVDDASRAELHLGAAALRLDQRTGFSFLNLDDRTVQVRLSQGTLEVRLRRLDEDETFEVDTPNLAFSLLRPGLYRLDVAQQGDSTAVTVLSGDGEVTGGGQAFPVHARQQARVSGVDSLSYDVGGAPGPDRFDDWCADRERREDRAESARYVSRDMVGYEDLDEYGSWRTMPPYGPVWAPRGVAAGWAPYRYGHWAWIEPWGWTWVDDAPWGFAPFHYGRWVFVDGGWGWVPGPLVARPVYAPALVAWVGGPRFSVSVAVGGRPGVAWFPLGPGEVFVPAYHVSRAYVTNVNVTNTVVNNITINNVYNNAASVQYINRTRVTAVSQETFVSARSVARSRLEVPPGALEQAQVTRAADVAPQRYSVLGHADVPAHVARPPAAALNRSVVVRAAPPPPPVPFSRRQEALNANHGRPLDAQEINRLRPAGAERQPLIREAMPARGARPEGIPAGGRQPRVAPAETPQPQREARPEITRPQRNVEPQRTPPPEVTRPQTPQPQRSAPEVVRPAPQPQREARPETVRPQRNVEPQRDTREARPVERQPAVERPARQGGAERKQEQKTERKEEKREDKREKKPEEERRRP